MEPMPLEDFSKLYNETGIDVDGRVAELNDVIIPAFTNKIHDLLMFMKSLPHFNQIPSKDKVSLLKGICKYEISKGKCPYKTIQILFLI